MWPSSRCVPPVETQVVSIVLFFLSLWPFPVFPFLVICCFAFACCIAFSALLFASLLSLVADSVLLSRWYTPPALLARLQICVFSLCAVLFSCVLEICFVFLLFLAFFLDFDLDPCLFQAVSFAVLFFFDSILAFQPIVDLLRPPSHGVGRVLLGMS